MNYIIPIGQTVELNPAEYCFCQEFGKIRLAKDRKAGLKNPNFDPVNSVRHYVVGIAAELTFCKLLNIYPKPVFDCEPGNTNGHIWVNGKLIEIKGTHYDNPRFLLNSGKSKATWPHEFVLVKGPVLPGEKPRNVTMTFCGSIAAEIIFNRKPQNPGDGSSCYIANPEELKDFFALP